MNEWVSSNVVLNDDMSVTFTDYDWRNNAIITLTMPADYIKHKRIINKKKHGSKHD